MKRRLEDLGRIEPVWMVLSFVAVGTFALAQPLLDLLGRNPEFFIARRFPGLDIVLLAAALTLLPAVLAIPVLLARLAGARTAAVIHLVILAALTAVAAATVLVTVGAGTWNPWLFGLVVAGAGALVAWSYLRFSTARVVVRYLSLAPIVVVVWFLFGTPTSQVVFSGSAELPEAGSPDNPVPVVLLVFDEFPLASIMRGNGSLDTEHFPNFTRLAGDGVWYRNAVGVRQQTEEALPSILTGVAVSEGSIPTTADHPFNLFTLLSDAYDVAAVENVTELCPDFVCANASRPVDPPQERWRSVIRDLAVVYGHIVLPESLAEGLPPIDQGWGGFDQQAAADFDIIERFLDRVADDRRLEVERFLETFDDTTSEPLLRFGHFLYPHHPWDLNANGTIHGAPRPPGRFEVGWGPDEFLVAQAWQRHLLQVQATDGMLGKVLDRLQDDGLYDDALVMVVADHGITIEPNTEHQRVVTAETIGTIAAVPLFVKYPAGFERAPDPGTVDDERAETIDLIPTIAEVIDLTVPWRVDGVSLLDPGRASRDASVMLGSRGEVEIPARPLPALSVAAAKESLFPGGDPFALTPEGWSGLLGAEMQPTDDPDVTVTVDQADALIEYQPGDERVPSYLAGSVTVAGEATGQEILAVVVDGIVRAVTRSYDPSGASARWEAMIEPVLLDSGRAVVEVVAVTGGPASPIGVY